MSDSAKKQPIPYQFAHPLADVYEDQSSWVAVGRRREASFAMVNLGLQGEAFGAFQVPSLRDLLGGQAAASSLLDVTALSDLATEKNYWAFVPPETARSLLLEPATHPVFRDILVKGTGLVEKFVKGNKLRDPGRGFNGLLELSEACRDFVYGEILHAAGVLLARPLAVVNLQHVAAMSGFDAVCGTYSRAFRVQTRISNLFELSPVAKRKAIDDAVARCIDLGLLPPGSGYVEYFFYMLRTLARAGAIYQGVGYTQDSLHFGQVTLAGEMVDFGIGHFRKPRAVGDQSALHPWFRYERQPLLLLNMLWRTHALKAEPHPVRLPPGSDKLTNQRSLFSVLAALDPQAGAAIRRADPEGVFWKHYGNDYRRFQAEAFRNCYINGMHRWFDWEPDGEDVSEQVLTHFRSMKTAIERVYEKQVATWDRPGLTSMHKFFLYAASVQRFHGRWIGVPPPLHALGLWPTSRQDWFRPKASNGESDLSWRPRRQLRRNGVSSIMHEHKEARSMAASENRERLEREAEANNRAVAAFVRKWPLNARILSGFPVSLTVKGVTRRGVKSVLVISNDGLRAEERARMQADYLQDICAGTVASLVSHQKDPHFFLRVNHEFIDYKLTPLESNWFGLRRRPYQMASRFKMDVIINLTRPEFSRLERYLANIEQNCEKVLGPLPERIHEQPELIEVEVLTTATKGALDDNGLLSPERHNCLTWFSLAPLGDDGARVYQLLGMTDADIKRETHSWTLIFAQFLLTRPRDIRSEFVVIQTGQALATVCEEMQAPDWFERMLLLDPDP